MIYACVRPGKGRFNILFPVFFLVRYLWSQEYAVLRCVSTYIAGMDPCDHDMHALGILEVEEHT